MSIRRAALAVTALGVLPAGLQAQSFDQLTRPMVEITDPDMMDRLLSELLIVPPDSLEAIRLVDITGNGYGPNDLLVVLPGEQVHYLDMYMPLALRQMMDDWESDINFRAELRRGEEREALLAAHLDEDPARTIAGACVDAIAANYAGDDMSLLVRRTGADARVEMWNFDPLGLGYDADSGGAVCEVQTQRFRFAAPLTVNTLIEGERCVSVWVEQGQVKKQPCEQQP